MRPLVGAPPPIALPLSMAPLPRELSFDVFVLPPALLRVGARCLLRLDSHARCATARGCFVAIRSAPLIAPPLCAVSSEFVVLPSAPLLAGFRCRVRLGSWVPLSPLCDCPWALRCLSLFRPPSLPRSARLFYWLLCCLLLRCSLGSVVAYGLVRGRASAPWGECSQALRCLLPCCSPSLLYALCFEVAMPHAAPPLVGLRCGPCLGPWALFRPLCDFERQCTLCCLLLLRSRSLPALCVVFRCYGAASGSIAP